MRDGTPKGKRNAAGALGNLLDCDGSFAGLVGEAVPELRAVLRDGTPGGQGDAAAGAWANTSYPYISQGIRKRNLNAG